MIAEILKNKKIEDPFKKFKKELEENKEASILTKLLRTQKFKKEVAEFGLELLRKNDNYYDYITLGSKQATKFEALLIDNIWENPNYYSLLVYFFGDEKAKYVKKAWDAMPHKMYQSGYARRSFRAPENKKFIHLNQLNFLRSALQFPSTYNYGEGGTTYYNLTIEEQIRFDTEITNSTYQHLLWSMAIDSGDDKIFQLFEDIIFNNDEIGKVTRNIIKALLNSEKKESWQLVEKLLLSAQRQEGLRQTILEALDETSIGALKYMIDVIIENKLTRFSSVVRSIDTWTGLGWDSEKETTVRAILSFAQQFLNNPETIKDGIESKNNNEVYMALWSQGVLDIEKTAPFLHQLLDKGSIEKKSLALKFAREIGHPYIEMPLYFKALDDENLQVLAFALPGLEALLSANVNSKFYIDNADYPDFFEKIYNLTQKIDFKEKVFEGKVFSWLNTKFDRNSLYQSLIYLAGDHKEKLETILNHFEEFSINLRETITRTVLKDFYCYSFSYGGNNKENQIPTDSQRQFALRILKDRGESILASAVNVLSKFELTESELGTFQDLLKRKNSTLRKNLLSLILKQNDKAVAPFIENTIENGDIEQRSASLELMLQLQKNKRLENKITDWTASYKEKKKISEREEKLLEQLEPSKDKKNLSAENGYTLYNPKMISSYEIPKIETDSVYSKLTKSDKYGFSKPVASIKKDLEKLHEIFTKHSDYEYEYENYNNTAEKVLLGNDFYQIKRNTEKFTDLELFQNYPLYEIWDQWFIESKLTASDLYLLTMVENCDRKIFREFLEDYIFYYKDSIPNPNKKHYYSWNNPILNILNALENKYKFEEKNEFLIDATAKLYSKIPSKILEFKQKEDKNYYYNRSDGDGWQSTSFFDIFLTKIELNKLSENQIKRVCNLYRWRQFNGLKENIPFSMPPLYLYAKAFQHQFISEDELYEGVLEPDRISILTGEKKHYQHYGSESLTKDFPFLNAVLENIRETFLDVELKRGDTNTSVTKFVQNFQKIYGIKRFAEIIAGLGKGNLYKGYIYSWNSSELSKQQLFSVLIKRCFPRPEETQEEFNALIKKEKITELRLIQVAIYAPQWQSFISNYLGWKGLDSAIWWMHAHTKTSGYQDQNSELESEVAKYSAVDLQDFKDGAVDKVWFEKAYKELGKAKWELLYDSAKYVSDGNGHRRARLYADTILGDLKIREVTAKVKDKRDQDYLRVYGLVPLSKANPEKDVLSRYEYIQQFKKESREFGSMKQASEALAIRVALENLARNAGYPDPIRLTWAMETKQVQNILSKETQAEIEGITVGLIIDEEGKAELVTFKDDKQLKAIPAKIKKHALVLELTQHRKTLREQFNRSRKGLEEAMIRGDEFLFSEIENLFEHPVISKHLEKLVFISDEKSVGFYEKGKLITVFGEEIPLTEKNTLRIAHCVDLHEQKVWTEFQSYCFDQKLKQPFKQIFRELYIPTPDELQEKSISRRYAGHQVQPRQTLALLKTRGWKVDYEEGLQKGFHKEGFQVKLYAMADWFSPADVESPTLETIEFHSLKDYKNIAFADINPRIFSEVMRDVDLIVSVAHVGGVDPEASHSSIEMRAVLLRETARLFKLNNVEISGSHAKIKGKMANYSVHLGSAVVHQIPGKYLSILPIHSQHRGRLFLPFADEDPKSAEVISKVLLLSKDDEIQDPTILSQIDRKIGT